MLLTSRLTLHLAAAALLGAGLLGPPRIHVKAVTPGTPAAPGTVLLIEASHHDETERLGLVGRAEGMVGGKRVTTPLKFANPSKGKYALTQQWQAGTPWLLVITAEDGPNGAHAVAEALVKVDAAGTVQGIEYPTPSWEKSTNTPKRVSAREIDAMVASMSKP